jgi:hypothetical protein
MARSISNSASMRWTASSAMGEIAAGFPPLALRSDVGQHEELAPAMGPAGRLQDRAWTSTGSIELLMSPSMPVICSVGAPPERRHATRVVAGMAQWLIGERARIDRLVIEQMRLRSESPMNPR